MSNYIPEIGTLFTVGSDTNVYQRCSSGDIKSRFDVFVPENYVYFMYGGFCGELNWNYFGKFSEFKPVVPSTHKEIKMEEKIITVHGKNFKVVKTGNQGACFGCSVREYPYDCDSYRKHNNGRCDGVIFKEVLVRPPIGIMPLVNHNAMRLDALMDTLQRYAESGSPVKVQWVQEVKSLIEYERSLTREALSKVPFKL